jgi:hypothetical protein
MRPASVSPPPSPFKISDLISIEAAAESIDVSPSAARRWAREGLKVGDGPNIKLTHVYIGGRIRTQLVWVEEFLAAVTRARSQTEPPVSVEQSARRARELADVDRDLDREFGPRPRDTVPLRNSKSKAKPKAKGRA